MNVLETLKINNASILKLKEGDILFIKIPEDANDKQFNEIKIGFRKTLDKIGLNDVTIVVSNSIQDVKIIRR